MKNQFNIIVLSLVFLTTAVSFSESLWMGEKVGLFDDRHAKNVGDAITVIVDESFTSTQKSNNSLANQSNVAVGPGSGYTSFLSSATALPAQSNFTATGQKDTDGELKTEVTVRVKEVLPNGQLVIFGNRETNINGERQIVEISGIVRPEDITIANKVYSSSLADAHINYAHEGEMKGNSESGIFNKIFNMVF